MVKSMAPYLVDMDQAECYQFLAQAGVMAGRHADAMLTYIATGALPGAVTDDDTVEDAVVLEDSDDPGKSAARNDDKTEDQVVSAVDVELDDITPSDVIEAENDAPELAPLATLAVPQALHMAEELITASYDDEAVGFLIASRVAKLWKTAYAEDRGEITAAPGETVYDLTANPVDGAYGERVRTAFRAEYEAAVALTPPAGWSFRPSPTDSEPVAPNLMQRHVATLLRNRKRLGNWSGTGAGKTVSAVLGARLIGAGLYLPDQDKPGLVVVVCPNNTKAGWRSVVTNCYPDNQVLTNTMAPQYSDWPGNGPRWLVINFEKLQQGDAQAQLSALLEHYRLDLLIVDEVHLIKYRQNKAAESARRLAIKGLSCEAGKANPDLAVLVMSATPVVNDLHEARSLIEVLQGVSLDDIDVRRTIANALSLYALLVRHGVRWKPVYPTRMNTRVEHIEIGHLLDDLRALGRHPHAADMERALLPDKMSTIVAECVATHSAGGRSLVYTHFVTELVNPIRKALEAEGLRVGLFTGTDKSGLAPFLGLDTTGGQPRQMRDDERVDVLIGSSAIGTGVDGLQDVADKLIFACLPWTSAEYQQITGRIYRQGQSHDVEVVIPSTWLESDQLDDPDNQRWSWDEYRRAVVTAKGDLSDAAVDGTIPKGAFISADEAAQYHAAWLQRVVGGTVRTVSRTPLDATLETLVFDRQTQSSGAWTASDFSRANRRWNATASAKTHKRLAADPTEWREYHAMYAAARLNWDTIPAHVFAGWLNARKSSPRTVADLGCGQMLLADRVLADGNPGGHTILAFDHVAVDDRVTACDISEVPLEDSSVDIAVLSLALMGANHGDYIHEAHRVLCIDGQLWIAETASRVGDNVERLRQAMFDHGFDLAHTQVSNSFTMIRATRADRAAVANPRPFLLTASEQPTCPV